MSRPSIIQTRTERVTENPWRVVAFVAVCLIVIMASGCASTPATPESAEATAYKAGRLGTHAYLASRSHLSVRQRERVRQVYVAVGLALDAAHAEGMESVRADILLADAIAKYTPDDDLRPFATELVAEIVGRIRQRLPADMTGLQSYRIAIAVHRGIADVLPMYQIDPDKEVTE